MQRQEPPPRLAFSSLHVEPAEDAVDVRLTVLGATNSRTAIAEFDWHVAINSCTSRSSRRSAGVRRRDSIGFLIRSDDRSRALVSQPAVRDVPGERGRRPFLCAPASCLGDGVGCSDSQSGKTRPDGLVPTLSGQHALLLPLMILHRHWCGGPIGAQRPTHYERVPLDDGADGWWRLTLGWSLQSLAGGGRYGRSGAQWGHAGQMWRHQTSRTLMWFASERSRSERASPLDRALVGQ